MQEYLNELEIVKIEAFCADTEMYEAVKKVVLQHIYSQGVMEAGVGHNPMKNRAFQLAQHCTENPVTNEAMGAQLRGVWEGVNALESGYQELKNIKSATGAIKTPFVNEAE
jgi:hypothetical protein